MASYPLMVSVSGVRGIVGKSLVPSVVETYVSRFCHTIKKHGFTAASNTVIIGRDSRFSGPWIFRIVESVLQAMGLVALAVGIVPTPTVQYQVIKQKAAGGIIVTSSHNPEEWNGLKFVDNTGLFLSPELCQEMYSVQPNEIEWPSFRQMGSVAEYHNAIDDHVTAILDLPELKSVRNKLIQKKFIVCLDTINGAGGVIMKKLLESLGCTVYPINYEPTGFFAHNPEPVPANLTQLCEEVISRRAHLGIAVDPDVDRCVLIDETGVPIGEEYTLALAVQFWLGSCGKRGPVVKNLSSSRANDDIAAKYGCSTVATPVGEINVAKKMVNIKAVIGGEGNGGVMLPDVHIGRDAPVAAAIILHLLGENNCTLSQLKANLPQWHIVKLKASIEGVSDFDNKLTELAKAWKSKGAVINLEDGVRIDTPEWWVHVRKSNTEPIVRVIGEAKTEKEATDVCNQFMKEITQK